MKGDIIRVEHAEELEERLAAESDNGIKIRSFLNAFGNRNLSYEAACALCGIHTSRGYIWVRDGIKVAMMVSKRAETRAACAEDYSLSGIQRRWSSD